MGKKGQKNKRRVPSGANSAPRPQKVPRVGQEIDFWNSHPIWSFALLDLLAPVGGWIHLSPRDLDGLLERFRRWESMTWKQILAEGGRKRNHPIDVSKCIPKAQGRLRYLKQEDREKLMSLAVNSTARVIGIQDGATFKILWWDPDHQICPSTMKYT